MAPTTDSDGESTRRGAIPEGARVQLDPSLDLDNLNLTGYEKTIARALQEDYVSIANIPADRFRVLTLPPQVPDPELALVPNACARWE